MITLYQFPEAFGLPVSVSPYCAKVELYFRLTGRAYRTAKGNVFKSPNKKVPYVGWPDGTMQAESADIIARLEAEGPALDEGLDPAALERGRELERAAEAVLYYSCLYSRFADDDGWVHQRPSVKALVPGLLSPILCPVIRRSQVKLCAENGFDSDGAYSKAIAVTGRIGEALGDQDFMLGDRPRTPDCGVWANLMQVAWTVVPSPARAAVRDHAELMDYIRRVAARADMTLPALS